MKRTPNGALVKQKMEAFAYRRKEVVESAPAIKQMVESWPALLTENQVYMEFNRIVGKNLKQEFYEGIDRHSVRLMEIFRSKRGHVGKNLADLIQQTRDTDDEDSFRHITIGLLIEHEDAAVPPNPETPQTSRLPDAPWTPRSSAPVRIVVEGAVVMDNIEDVPKPKLQSLNQLARGYVIMASIEVVIDI